MKASTFPLVLLAPRLLAACAHSAAPSSATPNAAPDADPHGEAPLSCVYSDTGVYHRTMSNAGQLDGRVTGTIRGTDHELVRDASVITLQSLEGKATLRARADSSGQFTVANVPAGKYELRIVSIGYKQSRDTIQVPDGGVALDVTQVIIRFNDEIRVCKYLEAINVEPALTLARASTSTETHAMPGGGVIGSTLIARPTADGATFELRLENTGTVAVDVTRLCYPRLTGAPVRQFVEQIGPACYGAGLALAPGDTLVVRQMAQLRGQPGAHEFRLHGVDPPLLDAVVTLPLVRSRGTLH